MIKKYTLIVLSAILMSLVNVTELLAHPGHGITEGNSLVHFITEPVHIISFFAVLAVGAVIVLWYRTRKKKLVKVNA
jgi:H+/gluconate symporter-like permease